MGDRLGFAVLFVAIVALLTFFVEISSRAGSHRVVDAPFRDVTPYDGPLNYGGLRVKRLAGYERTGGDLVVVDEGTGQVVARKPASDSAVRFGGLAPGSYSVCMQSEGAVPVAARRCVYRGHLWHDVEIPELREPAAALCLILGPRCDHARLEYSGKWPQAEAVSALFGGRFVCLPLRLPDGLPRVLHGRRGESWGVVRVGQYLAFAAPVPHAPVGSGAGGRIASRVVTQLPFEEVIVVSAIEVRRFVANQLCEARVEIMSGAMPAIVGLTFMGDTIRRYGLLRRGDAEVDLREEGEGVMGGSTMQSFLVIDIGEISSSGVCRLVRDPARGRDVTVLDASPGYLHCGGRAWSEGSVVVMDARVSVEAREATLVARAVARLERVHGRLARGANARVHWLRANVDEFGGCAVGLPSLVSGVSKVLLRGIDSSLTFAWELDEQELSALRFERLPLGVYSVQLLSVDGCRWEGEVVVSR